MGFVITTSLLSFLLCSVVFVAKHVQPLYGKITLKDGNLIRGTSGRSIRSFKHYYAFKGIPYAEPPVGELRFAPPQPVKAWKNTLFATKDPPICMQKNYLFYSKPQVEGSEDCLYLNVYTPKLNEKLPVLVYIHLGAWFVGTGNQDFHGPEYFMDLDVVLVTFNYRLGIFGFLSTGDDAAPGNFGLKDQVAALQWIKSNIESFGGDSERITIFGQSAGAGAVHYHILSSATDGLFNQAMSFSGSALALWAHIAEPLPITRLQAQFVGCPNANNATTKDIIKCLQAVDAASLVESTDNFKYFSIEPITVYVPVTEKKTVLNPNPYITEKAIDIIKARKFKNIPWILGVTSDEGLIRGAPLIRQSQTRNELNEQLDTLGPTMLAVGTSVAPEEVADTWKAIKDKYISEGFINIESKKSMQDFVDLYTDRSFAYPSYQTALLHAKYGHERIWFYNFAYRGKYSYGDTFATTEENVDYKFGVSHCDDLLYIFKTTALFPKKDPLEDPSDAKLSRILLNMWTNFARSGIPRADWNPIPNLSNHTTVINSDLYYYNISGPYIGPHTIKMQMQNSFYPDRMRFWQNLPLSENVPDIQ